MSFVWIIVVVLTYTSYIDAYKIVIPDIGPIAHNAQLDHKKRVSSYPYISSDTFRWICDWWIDEARVSFYPEQMCVGDIIYLNPYYLDFFVCSVRPYITKSYILVTTNCLLTMPGKYKKLLDDELLVAWFAKNAAIEHEKLRPIPVGIPNAYYIYGDTKILHETRVNRRAHKDILLYVNILTRNNPKERVPLLNHFKRMSYAYVSRRKSYQKYLEDLARSKFAVSPSGTSIDCYRTWEAMLLGCIPIVKSSPIDRLFAGLPILIVEDWQDITQDFLEKKYKEMCNTYYQREKLYADYWISQIKDLQDKVRYEGK